MPKIRQISVMPMHVAAAFTQANPGDGTTYEALHKYNVELTGLTVECTWTVQPNPVDLYVTIDGETWHFQQANPVSTQNYIPLPYPNDESSGTHGMRTTAGSYVDMVFPSQFFSGRDVKVEAKVTGGTVSQLKVHYKYRQW